MAADRQIPTSASPPPVSGPTFMDAVQEEVTALFNAAMLPLSNYAGTTNDPTADVTPALTGALQNGMGFLFTAQATNTGAMTLAIGGTAAKSIVDRDGVALIAGMIRIGGIYPLVYDTTSGKLIAITIWQGVIGRQQRFFSCGMGEIYGRSTGGPSALTTVETATNKVNLKSLDFDGTTAEYAQFSFRAPKRWNEGTCTAIFVWAHPATTVNFGVTWKIQGIALSDNDAADAAFGTAIAVSDTGGVTNNIYLTAETAAMTLGGTPQEGDLLFFQVYRDPADASDTMAVDAKLLGVHLFWTADRSSEPV